MSAATTTSTNSTSDSTIVAPFEDIVQFIVNMNSKYNNRDKEHPLPQVNMLIPLGAFRILCAISNGTVSQHVHM
jgi:hypothetical protein